MSIINHILFDIFQRIKEHSHFKVIVIQIWNADHLFAF